MTQAAKKSPIERDIDKNLRKVYRRMVEEDVPDRFKDLLDELRQSERDSSSEQGK